MGNRLSWNWVLLLLLISSLYGGNTGKITGTVVDKETGDPLIGANVILDGTELGSSTDVDGFYSIINAPPGNYTLMAYYVGYATVVVENVRVNVDRTTRITVTMSPETVAGEEVLVEAQRPAIEMDRTHSASVVSSETVELMPVTELSEVLELQAGVVSSDGNLHFRGGRAREVTYIVDGVPITNAFNQDGGNSVVVENSMIEELEVISGTFNAEYGQAQSGVVNITTKRPARQFSGSVETYIGEYLSNQDDVYLGISDFDPLAERDLQLNLSGPILKDKLGFSFSGRYSLFESPDWYEKRYSPLDGWRVAAYDRWFVQANQSDLDESGVIPIPDSLTTGDGSRGPLLTAENMSMNFKLLFQPHPKVSFTYQTFGSTREFEGIPGADLRATNFLRRFQPDGYGTARSWQYSHFFRFQHFPSENFFYNLGASYQHEDGEYYLNKENKIARYPGDDGIMLFSSFTGPYAIGTIPIFYGGADDRGFVDQWLLNGDFNWQVNKSNFIKGGFLVKQHFINIYARGFLENEVWRDTKWLPEFENLIGPLGITFDQYWNIMSDYWRNWEANTNSVRYRQVEADDAGNFRDFNIYPMEMAFFLQDKIEMGDIIVNAGLRADIFQPNEVVPINLRTESFNLGAGSNLEDATIKYQLSPRLGVSFPIS
ncbi:MAG: carboxypeptidase-like regulatory domain-containing protein, partial [Calditrichaeota bacterium]|nr:carboxypeptidase-like regulatory domain-containing protein [Calditrichota bacterium]